MKILIFSIVAFSVCLVSFGSAEPEAESSSVEILKVAMTQKGYIQFLKYRVDVPPLTQFTFCLWMKSHNLSHSHPILSYSKHERDRYIRSRISKGGHRLKTSLMEQELVDIPLALKVYHWYHLCQSWDSSSGRWQVYLNGQLKSQGFEKNLRDLVIPGGGDIVVGQEYTDFDKGLDDGIEGEIFGFNMILSSTTEEPNHRYYHKDVVKDTQAKSTEINADIQNEYVRLIDLQPYKKEPKPQKVHGNNISAPVIKSPIDNYYKSVEYTTIKSIAPESTFDDDDEDEDDELLLRPPSKSADIPFWNLINKAGREGRFKFGEIQPLALTNLPIYETPPALPIHDDAPKSTPTFEMLYSQANFKGNKWYDQNDYFPKELLRRPKTGAKPKHRYGVPSKDQHPYPSENHYEHTIFRRDIREKNIEILNPDSVIVYPIENKILNVEVYPRAGDIDPTEYAETMTDEEEERAQNYEVEYSRLHYTGGKHPEIRYKARPGNKEPRVVFVNNPEVYKRPTHPAIGFVRPNKNDAVSIGGKRYPQSITDKINWSGDESDQFEKSVKLGNVLNEVQIFRQHGNDRVSSFVGSVDGVPDINKYRSDIDRESIYKFDEINVNNHQVLNKLYKNDERYRQNAPKSAGRKMVELGYRKCLLDGGSALAKDAASLISWTLTPMRIFGGATLKKASTSCGGF